MTIENLTFFEMNIPSNLLYTKEHEWIRVENNVAFVGVTDYAQTQLGDVVFVDLGSININDTLGKGDTFGTIEAVKTVSDMYMPVGGTILEINAQLESNPELINQDPYGNGWIIKITVTDASELGQLLTPEQYAELTAE